jgi:PAS domain S-box-containing protein
MLTGENLSRFWDEYSEAPEDFYRAAESKSIVFTDEYTDRWGTFTTVIIPEYSPGGRLYFLCADMEISELRKLYYNELPRILFTALFFLLILLPFVLSLISHFRKQNVRLEEKVEERTKKLVQEIQFRRNAEEVIKQSEEKFSVAFNRTPVLMMISELHSGIVVDVNEYFVEVTGIPKSKIVGSYMLSFPFFESAKDFEEIRRIIQTESAVRGFEIRYLKKDGIGTCSFSAEVIKLNNKPHILAIVYDLSERVRFEQELVQARIKAEESDQLKSAFLANMSHEVRTPLNGIIGFADLLKEENSSPEEREQFLDIITENGRNLLALINDIIDISKIEAGQMKLFNAPMNLNSLLKVLQSTYRNEVLRSGKNELEIVLELGLDDKDGLIITDEVRLRQVLTNLLSNALKFTVKGRITIRYALEESMLAFYVTDTGIGIPSRSLQHIFNRFDQAEAGTTRKYGGAGLGLAISKALVTMLGGDISVQSEEGKGTAFRFVLPYVRQEISEHVTQTNGVKKQTDSTWQNKTILVVEDDEASVLYLKVFLEKHGANVLSTDNGKSAVELVKAYPQIDLVLMDIQMPVMDGYAATREIKKIRTDLPVVAQTAYAMLDDKERVMASGFDDYISKPLKRESLIAVLCKFLD